MLYVPGQLLVLVEAKFTSGNTIASASATHDVINEKPKSREGILDDTRPLYCHVMRCSHRPSSEPLYSQLYRNLVFAIYMANKLDVRWASS